MTKPTRILTLRSLQFALAALLLTAAGASADRPDGWITAKVKTRLLTKAGVPGLGINVDTNDRVVTLHGVVASEAERQRAVEQARRTEGVRDVQDLLVVSPPEGGAARHAMRTRDDQLEREVERALNGEGKSLERIHVKSVNNGTVLLTGQASSQHDQLEAISVASAVPGVREVGSTIETGDAPYGGEVWEALEDVNWNDHDQPRDFSRATADAWITTKVKTKLLVDPELPGTGINVDTRNAYVTLFGTVADRSTSALAASEAMEVDGVMGVRNELQVVRPERKAASERADSEAESRLSRAVGEREGLDGVKVSVKGGAARLTGTVPSHELELRALYLARATEGVGSVVNDLRVVRPQG